MTKEQQNHTQNLRTGTISEFRANRCDLILWDICSFVPIAAEDRERNVSSPGLTGVKLRCLGGVCVDITATQLWYTQFTKERD